MFDVLINLLLKLLYRDYFILEFYVRYKLYINYMVVVKYLVLKIWKFLYFYIESYNVEKMEGGKLLFIIKNIMYIILWCIVLLIMIIG